MFHRTAKVPIEPFINVMAQIPALLYGIIALLSFVTMFFARRWLKMEWFESLDRDTAPLPAALPWPVASIRPPTSYTWEAFGVALGVLTMFTSTFAAVLPAVTMQSQWIIVALGGGVTLALILFGKLVIRRQKE